MIYAIKYGTFNIPEKKETDAQIKQYPRYNASITYLNSAGEVVQKDQTIYKTPYVWNKYSPYPSNKYIEDDKRTFLKLTFENYNPETNSGDDRNKEIMEYLRCYEIAYSEQKKEIFNNNKKKYDAYVMRIVKKPEAKKSLDDDDDEQAEKPFYAKINIEMLFNMYYEGEKLDQTNKNIINKKIFDGQKRTGDAFKTHKAGLSFKLHIPNGNAETKLVEMSDIEERRDFDMEIAYREIEGNPTNLKHPADCSLTELNEIYGKPKKIVLKSVQDFEKYCKWSSYISYKIMAKNISANKKASPLGDEWAVKPDLTCISMSIIHIKGSNNTQKTMKQAASYFDDENEEIQNLKEESHNSKEETHNLKEEYTNLKSVKTNDKSNDKSKSDDESDDDESDDDESDDDESDDDEESDESSEEKAPVVKIQSKTKQNKSK